MRIGIDLGGTKIEGLALDENGVELLRLRIPTPAQHYEGILQAVAQVVQELERHTGQQGSVGIGTPGAISRTTGLLKNSNTVCLNGKPLDRDLERILARPVRIANDANCFALSEATDGAAAGAEIVFGVIIGTGTGGGLVVHGQLLSGANHIAGEWGHNPLPWPQESERPGPACYCGKHGCIETFLSGPGLAHDYLQAAGLSKSAIDIARAAQAGDALCEQCLQRYEDRLARALASVINIVDPDVIVLGGGLSNLSRLYQHVPVLLPRYVFSDHVATRLVANRHGDSSGVRGAAWLWGS